MFDGSTDGKISLFFPSRYLQNKQVIKNEENVVVSLPEYVSNATAPHHWNWHTIGVPSFANSKVTIEQNDMPFVYEYWHPGDAYGPVAHGEKPLKAMLHSLSPLRKMLTPTRKSCSALSFNKRITPSIRHMFNSAMIREHWALI